MPKSRQVIEPYWSIHGAALYLGDARECIGGMKQQSVHSVVTSPPYWGLRDYGTGTWEGGSVECDHIEKTAQQAHCKSLLGPMRHLGISLPETNAAYRSIERQIADRCGKCGAVYTDRQLGSEEILDCLGWATENRCGECYICHMVGVFTEVHRVLRDDGTLWLNLGDTFDGNQQMVPARVALALEASGWVLRQDIIWYAPNKLPEPVTNRCGKSHEHILLLTKWQSGYYFDKVAIEVNGSGAGGGSVFGKSGSDHYREYDRPEYPTVNKRDVWVVPVADYPGAHFATFSPELITPCILAGTSEYGCCSECEQPYERAIQRVGAEKLDGEIDSHRRDRSIRSNRNGVDSTLDTGIARRKTVGWRKTCRCECREAVPCTVLDPFVGSGTTVATAVQLGRAGVGIDLSREYLQQHAIPRVVTAIQACGPVFSSKMLPAPNPSPPPRRLR